jgi:hypothetical protein
MKATEMANKPRRTLSGESRGTLTGSGAGSRDKNLSASGRGRNFFLTSLLIELIESISDFATNDDVMSAETVSDGLIA